MLQSYDIVLEGCTQPLARCDSCTELLEPIQRFLGTWPVTIGLSNPSDTPLITINQAASGGYTLTAPWLPSPLRELTPACLLCSLSIELIMAVCRCVPPVLHMHAAAVQLPAGVCLLLGNNRAGKSSLVTRLMAEGYIGFGDDLVGIMPGSEVFSFGIPPRLRLPLPPSPVLRAFVRAHAGEADERYRYLEPGLSVLAPFGTRRKIEACIFLRRRARSKTVLRNCASDPRRLIPHCVLHQGAARAALEAMQCLSAAVPCFTLEYADLDGAVGLLRAPRLAEACLPEPRPAGGRFPCRQRFAGRFLLSSTPCRRKEGILCVPEDDGAYLVNERADALFHLNSTGKGIWQLLEYPLSEVEAVSLLHESFPGTPPGVVERDVARLFQELWAADLIEPCSDSSNPASRRKRRGPYSA